MAISLIDHCYTNIVHFLNCTAVVDIGSSDHSGIFITKNTKCHPTRPRHVIKRSYKYFNIEHFLSDVNESAINQSVTKCIDLEEAADTFQSMFSHILDSHAPIKKYQMRRHYLPFLSVGTKALINEKNNLFKQAAQNGYEIALLKQGYEVK